MSENLDLVRSSYADWERGDYSLTAWADPDIAYAIIGGPDPGTWTGVTEMAAGWRDWMSAWEDFEVEALEYRKIANERVLAPTRFRGRGKTSGLDVAEMRVDAAGLFHIRDGKVTRLALYRDRDRPFADLGLEE